MLTDALRSGEYKQTKQRLRNDEGFCCLGVACDIYMKETGDGEWVKMALGSSQKFMIGEVGSMTSLPKPVAEWFGIQGLGYYNSSEPHLAQLNDKGRSFQEIATFIDTNADALLSFR